MTPKKSKTQMGQFSDNPVESLRDAGREIISDLGTESVNALWDQILGNYSSDSQEGELQEGQEINLSQKSKESAPVEAAIDYKREILHGEKRISRETEQQLTAQMQEIIAELNQLINSSKELEAQFKDVSKVTVAVSVGKPGKYHVNFFSWVLSMVRSTRMRIEESASWLALFKSKKGQKQYWAMFKKHGTTFGMSNERMVATQTG